jgi:hypothetical protein
MNVRQFLRDNIVLVAAFVLPAAVAVLFIVATAIPKWTVPLPEHDLVLRVEQPFTAPAPEVSVDFGVRNGQVEAIVRPAGRSENPSIPTPLPPRLALLLFDHKAMRAREVPLDLPRSLPQGETRTITIEALAGRQIIAGDTAPDGYKVESLSGGNGGGIVGDLFGMNRRYRQSVTIRKEGRTIVLDLPAPYRDVYAVSVPIGWTNDDD